jgi:hypothetical protein
MTKLLDLRHRRLTGGFHSTSDGGKGVSLDVADDENYGGLSALGVTMINDQKITGLRVRE